VRDIKFRAFYNGKIYPVASFLYKLFHTGFSIEGGKRTEDNKIYISDGMVNHSGWINKNEVILIQYTGLKDKNGEEIYEDDIVERGNIFSGTTKKMKVYWNQNGCGWSLKSEKFNMAMSDLCDLRVIGNIYENPELLKETK